MLHDITTQQSNEISQMISSMFLIHDKKSKDSKKRMRKQDGLPYGVHPAFSGLLMLHEANVELSQRLIYAEALNYHDVEEDTLDDLLLISPPARIFVRQLTFSDECDSSEEAIKRGPEIAMLKSYDSTGNLFGLDLMPWAYEKKLWRIAKAEKLFVFARPHYPNLYIWPIAEALVATMKQRIRP